MSENVKNGVSTTGTPEVQKENHAKPVSKPKDERKMSLPDQILAVLPEGMSEALSNHQIRERLLMRSSRGKKGQADRKYRALHSVMQKLVKTGKVLFWKDGTTNRYYLAPEKDAQKD